MKEDTAHVEVVTVTMTTLALRLRFGMVVALMDVLVVVVGLQRSIMLISVVGRAVTVAKEARLLGWAFIVMAVRV